jgi:hypothetical protein
MIVRPGVDDDRRTVGIEQGVAPPFSDALCDREDQAAITLSVDLQVGQIAKMPPLRILDPVLAAGRVPVAARAFETRGVAAAGGVDVRPIIARCHPAGIDLDPDTAAIGDQPGKGLRHTARVDDLRRGPRPPARITCPVAPSIMQPVAAKLSASPTIFFMPISLTGLT